MNRNSQIKNIKIHDDERIDLKDNINELSNIFNYNFKNDKWVTEALTRQSAITERHPNASTKNYQRLEFLGDSVLSLVITDLIYELFPDKQEEDLHPMRSFIVKNETLGNYGEKLKIGKFIILGRGEEFQNVRKNKKILADVVESLIGAIFIDSGRDYDITKNVVLNFLKPVILNDKYYREYSNELNNYYDRLMQIDNIQNKVKIEKIKNIQNEESIENLIPIQQTLVSSIKLNDSLSNLSNLIYTKNKGFIDLNQSNKAKINNNLVSNILKSSNYSCTKTNIENNFHNIKINNLKQFSSWFYFDIPLIADLCLSKDKEEIQNKIKKIFQNVTNNYFIDYDLLSLNSNENFSSLLKNNIDTVECIISILMDQIQLSYENCDIKDHLFASKFLLNIVINLGNEISEFYFKSVFCLLHNGISEYYRKDYDQSKNFFDKVLDTLQMLESDTNKIELIEYKYICINYISDIAFITEDLVSSNNCVNIINSVELDTASEFRMLQFQKIFLKNFILNNSSNLNKINNFIDKFWWLDNLSEELKNSKLFLEDFVNMRVLKYKLNNSMNDLTEFKIIEELLQKKCGKESFLYVNIFILYIEKLQNEMGENKSYNLIERIAYLSNRIIKILLSNFTVSSNIFSDYLPIYIKILETYTNYNL